MLDAPLVMGSRALLWSVSGLTGVSREVFEHHLQAYLDARFCEPSVSRSALGAQDFIDQVTEELQYARLIRGGRNRTTPSSPARSPSDCFRVCVDIAGLNRAASQEPFWPTAVGRRRALPCSYVRTLFGFRNAAATFQHLAQQALGAREAQWQAVRTEREPDPRDH